MGIISVEPLRILERRVRQLRNRLVDQVNIQWDKYSTGSATWEDTKIMSKISQLVSILKNFKPYFVYSYFTLNQILKTILE